MTNACVNLNSRAASMDILSLLLLISWYFTLWKALLIGTLVHFFVVHFRLLKFFAVNAGKKIWKQVFSYPKLASAGKWHKIICFLPKLKNTRR